MKKPANPVNKLKIALVCDDSLDKQDGVQQYVLTLGGWLSEQGHDVHYLASETHRTDLPNLHVLARTIQLKFNGNRLGSPLPASPAVIEALLEKEKFDIIHVQAPYSPLLAGQVIRLAPKNTAIVGTFHIFPHSPLVSIGAKSLGLFLARQLLKFHIMLSVSKSAQEFCEQSFGLRSQVIPNMVDVARFSSTPAQAEPNKPLRIVFLGRLVERKGALYLLKAIRKLEASDATAQPFTVHIGGKGPMRDELMAYANDYRLSDIVTFDGFVEESNKANYLAHADIAIFPSTGGESFGISLIEAMAASRGAVLAGDNPGYRCVMGDREDQIVDPNNTVAFAQTLALFLEDAQLRKAAHTWQQSHVKQYDKHIVGQQIFEKYLDALRIANG